MIINYLDVKCIPVSPNETDAILIIDADAVLALPIAFQSFKAIPWEDGEITQEVRRVQLHKLSLRNSGDLQKPPRAFAFK